MIATAERASDDFFELASVAPADAMAEANRRLERLAPAESSERVRLLRVVGAARRELGDLDGSRETFEHGVALAQEVGDPALVGALQSSLAFVMARLGQLDRAIELFVEAEPVVVGAEWARLMDHKGVVEYWTGNLDQSASTLAQACDALARTDPVGEAKARVNLGAVLAELTRYAEAEGHLRRVISAGEALGGGALLAGALANLGYLEMLRTDIPAAIGHLAEAETILADAGAGSYLAVIWVIHARALAAAFLFEDAADLLERALARFEREHHGIEAASGLLALSQLRLAIGEIPAAVAAASEAEALLREQARPAWVALAVAYRLQAEARGTDDRSELPADLKRSADALEFYGWTHEALRCRLVVARLSAETDPGTEEVLVDPAIRAMVRRGRAPERILLAQIDSIAASRRGDVARARRCISHGLRMAMGAQALLGSIETRAHAGVRGAELMELGARLAIADGRPRELLARIEATRMLSSRLPVVRAADDPTTGGLLAELRGLEVAVADASTGVDRRQEAEQRRVVVEREVHRRARSRPGDVGASVDVPAEVRQGIDLLDDRQLLAHASLDGDLLAVTVTDGRAHLHRLGPIAEVAERLDAVTFALNRLNRVQGSEASREAAAEMLHLAAFELAELLLPTPIAESDRRVVVVPTAVLHDVPWGLLPPLGGRAVSINPSLSAWARAERSRVIRVASRQGDRTVGFVAGPDLEFAELEVDTLRAGYTDAVVIAGAAATSEACLELMQRCDLVHVACHGSFRSDNPMFSAIHMADGPLNLYDVGRLERLPEVVVLSACSVAGAKVLQGGSLLGLAAAMTTFGAASVIAPLTPISDASSVTVMQRLHRALVAGASPPAALAAATISHDVADPTAAAFIALGA